MSIKEQEFHTASACSKHLDVSLHQASPGGVWKSSRPDDINEATNGRTLREYRHKFGRKTPTNLVGVLSNSPNSSVTIALLVEYLVLSFHQERLTLFNLSARCLFYSPDYDWVFS
jgi:hypothetical protein